MSIGDINVEFSNPEKGVVAGVGGRDGGSEHGLGEGCWQSLWLGSESVAGAQEIRVALIIDFNVKCPLSPQLANSQVS